MEALFLLAPKVQRDISLAPRRDPEALVPLGNAPLEGGPDGVLSFGEKRKPEMALIIAFRGLELISVGGLQSYVSVSDGAARDVEHLATDGAESRRRRRSKAADSYYGTQQCS
jgi:hypothetical protein